MPWFDDDTFWETFSSYIYADERLRTAAADVSRMLAWAEGSRPDVLDLCCGTGRHAVAFARLGCRTTGVDRTRFALERARVQRGEGWGHRRIRRTRHAASSRGRPASTSS